MLEHYFMLAIVLYIATTRIISNQLWSHSIDGWGRKGPESLAREGLESVIVQKRAEFAATLMTWRPCKGSSSLLLW